VYIELYFEKLSLRKQRESRVEEVSWCSYLCFKASCSWKHQAGKRDSNFSQIIAL